MTTFEYQGAILMGMTHMMMWYMGFRSFGPEARTYRLYTLYLLGINVFTGVMFIYLYERTWLDSVTHDYRLIRWLAFSSHTLAYIFYFTFVAHFLNLRVIQPTVDLVFRKTKVVCWVLLTVFTAINFLSDQKEWLPILIECERIILVGVSLFALVKMIPQRHGIVMYFILGNGLYLFFALISWGINAVYPEWLKTDILANLFGGLDIAVIAESICFALGISYKEGDLDRNTRNLQAQVIHSLHVSNRQQEAFSENLTEKVNEQAHELLRLQLEKYEIDKQEELMRERERLAADLHEELGSSLSAIQLLASHLQESKDQDISTLKNDIDLIRQSSEHLNQRLREIIWTMDAREEGLTSLVDFIARYAHEWGGQVRIPIQVSIPDHLPDIMLPDGKRQNLFLCVKEAVHNALRHGQPSLVEISMNFSKDQYFSVRIKDDGKGFDYPLHTSKSHGQGLINMQERMAEIGGSVRIESTPQGTMLTLILPL